MHRLQSVKGPPTHRFPVSPQCSPMGAMRRRAPAAAAGRPAAVENRNRKHGGARLPPPNKVGGERGCRYPVRRPGSRGRPAAGDPDARREPAPRIGRDPCGRWRSAPRPARRERPSSTDRGSVDRPCRRRARECCRPGASGRCRLAAGATPARPDPGGRRRLQQFNHPTPARASRWRLP